MVAWEDLSGGGANGDIRARIFTAEPPNSTPDAIDDARLIVEGGSTGGNVLANDQDPDGDELAVTEIDGSAAGVGQPIQLASGASLLLNADGSFQYDSNDAFDHLLEGEVALDTFTYTVSDGTDTDTATVGVSIAGRGLRLVGTNRADTLVGGSDDDILEGLRGADRLDGGAGADQMIGGLGNDRYVVDDTGDTVVEQSGAGTDRVETILNSYALTEQVEQLNFVGIGVFAGTGNVLANRIESGAGNDVLNGGDGDDQLIAQGGADVLVGAAGDDVMNGGSGTDVFLFEAAGFGGDKIAGFDANPNGGQDLIDLSAIVAAADFASIERRQLGSDTLLELGDDAILLAGVRLASVTQADFLLG
jgi:VCBS repeat-containing protein